MTEPIVIIVFGLPGSGKSYFASRLAMLINADYINSDRLRKVMFQKRTYSDEEKAAVYEAMLGKMKEALNESRNVVLDATFHKNEKRELFIKKLEGKGVIFFIEVKAEENITRERLKETRPYSEADFDSYQLLRNEWEPFYESHLTLESTNENIDNMLKKAAEYLRSKDDKRTGQ